MKNYNQLVKDYFSLGREPYKGEIGIEIEVEGKNLPLSFNSYWTVHNDGSLRGESAEYVLSEPIKRDNVLPFLKYLDSRLKNSTIKNSIRTSVHVHINMSEKTILQVFLILIVYYILEDIIMTLAGEDRVGNLFCLRASDAEHIIDILELCAKRDVFTAFLDENNLRYAAANICALGKFNSLEFRALKGTTDPVVISEWISLLLEMIDNTLVSYKTPVEIIQDFSAFGSRRFLEKILPTYYTRLILKNGDVDKLLWEGLRMVQGLAYVTKWEYSDYRPVKRVFGDKKKPFGEGTFIGIQPEQTAAQVIEGIHQEQARIRRRMNTQQPAPNNPPIGNVNNPGSGWNRQAIAWDNFGLNRPDAPAPVEFDENGNPR